MPKDKKKLDSGDACTICNLTVYVLITALAIYLIWHFVPGIPFKILLSACAVVALAYFEEKILVYPVGFMVELVAKRIKAEKTMEKKYVNITLEEFMGINPLPEAVDWSEVDKFLLENRSKDVSGRDCFFFTGSWGENPLVKEYGLSDSSIKVLDCLSGDLNIMFSDFTILDENKNEDRNAEYRFLEDWLHTKYRGLSKDLLNRIYGDYRIMDR